MPLSLVASLVASLVFPVAREGQDEDLVSFHSHTYCWLPAPLQLSLGGKAQVGSAAGRADEAAAASRAHPGQTPEAPLAESENWPR